MEDSKEQARKNVTKNRNQRFSDNIGKNKSHNRNWKQNKNWKVQQTQKTNTLQKNSKSRYIQIYSLSQYFKVKGTVEFERLASLPAQKKVLNHSQNIQICVQIFVPCMLNVLFLTQVPFQIKHEMQTYFPHA